MYVSAILLAAGRGSRFGSKIPKPLVKINSKPIIIYSLLVLNAHPQVKEIIVVVNNQNSDSIIKTIEKFRIAKINKVIFGGARRQDSVYNGLKLINRLSDLVLIHDVARPFINKKIVSMLIKQANLTGAAILGVPVKDTIKEVVSRKSSVVSKTIIKKTLDRNRLWEIQTPQVFKKGLILEAYRKFNHLDVTDDAMLVEKLGRKVSVVCGSYNNIKITTPEDLILAEAISQNLCIG